MKGQVQNLKGQARNSPAQVLVLGGGFGGLSVANTLRPILSDENTIALVDHSTRFHVGAGKPWVMLGERTSEGISEERGRLLEPGVEFVQSEILQIDLPGRRVVTASGVRHWDYLVVALGADVRQASVPGLSGAHTFYTVEGAERLKPVLEGFTGGDIVILIPKTPYKCPAAPYETVMLMQHHFSGRGLDGKVRLSVHTVEGAPMATGGPEMGAFIRAELARRGIGFFPQRTVLRVDGEARRVEFSAGDAAPYDLLICVPPHEAPAVVRSAGLAGPSGWIPVDPLTMEVTAVDGGGRVYAIGDVASVALPGRFKPEMSLSLPKAGTIASSQGEVVARRIAARVAGETPSAAYEGKGYCYLELGGGEAVRGDGSFFALPHPVMSKQPASPERMAEKLDWMARCLRPRRTG
jgi:sulfide:quinone oxidoreductase